MSRISQYVYFGVFSETVDAGEMTKRLGIEADRTIVRGSRIADPPRPVSHGWQIRCDEPGLRIHEQVEIVLARLRPIEPHLIAVATDPACNAVLQLVRYFDDPSGEPEQLSAPEDILQKLAGQHQLLGWHLSWDDLCFLARIHASIDADEYG